MSELAPKSNDPLAAIMNELAEIRRLAEEAGSRAMYIPTLAQDPPETDPTNVWLFPDGRLRMRHKNPAGTAYVYREYSQTTPGSSTSATAPAPPSAAPQTYQNYWSATWSQSYRSGGSPRTDEGVYLLYYGSAGDSYNGTNRSLIGFDYAAIATELAGSTINNAWIEMTNVHSWYYSGVEIYFGIHNFPSEPATWAGGGIPRQRIAHGHWPDTGTPPPKVVPIEFATSIRDGWGKGIAIEPPSSSREFYGYAAGVGSGKMVPRLHVNYTK